MRGRGTAAASDHAGAGGDHARRIVGHVGGRREVYQPLAHPARQTGVGLDHHRKPPRLGEHLLQDVVEHAGANRAVGAHSLYGQLAQRSHYLDRRPPEEGDAVVGEGHLGHDGQVGDRANGLDGQPHLHQIREGLDDEDVHSPLEQPFGLLLEGRARLVGLDGAQRRQVFPERANGAQHEHIAAHALADVPRQLGAAQVDLPDPPRQAVDPQLEAVGAEGVGLDTVRARGDVLGVDAQDDLRVVDTDDVEARVQRHAAGIEHGAHGPVAEEGTLGQPRDEGRRHYRTVRSPARRSRERRVFRICAATWSGPTPVVSTAKWASL